MSNVSDDFLPTSPGLTPEALDAFAWHAGRELPDALRPLYERWNGGRPSRPVVLVPGTDQWIFLHEVRPLSAPGGKSPLARTWRLVGDVLPEDLFPFGDDPGGDFFCVNVRDWQRRALLRRGHAA